MVSSSKCAMDNTIQRTNPLFIIMSKFVTSHHKQLIIVEIKCFQFCLYHGSKHPKKFALYIQISKSTASQTIHKNLMKIIQKFVSTI